MLSNLEQAYVDSGAGKGAMPSLDLWSNLIRTLGDASTERQWSERFGIVCISVLRAALEEIMRVTHTS